MSERQRIDLWLFRARLAKTRAAAARLIAEGGVRLVHEGAPRRLEKPSTEIEPGDALMVPLRGKLLAIRIEALGARRGPAAEARTLYSELDADALA
ncbi:MAG: S4 domain-containing protein [Hyphomonadaceae bacterium]